MSGYRTIRSNRARLGQLSWGDRVVLCLMFLLPVPTFLGEVAARAADAVRFGSVVSHLFSRGRLGQGRHTRRINIILLLMFLCGFLSLVCGESHSIRDFLDVLRIVAFWTVFIFGASLCWRGQSRTDAVVSFSKFLLLIGALNALFTLSQYVFPEATRPVQAFYTSDERHIDLLPEQGRAFGFFGNPNTNAVMLLLLSLPGLVIFQLTKQTRYLILGVLVLSAVVLTSSRTGLVLAAVMVAVLCIASRKLTYLAALALVAWLSYVLLAYLVTTGTLKDWFPYLSDLLSKIYGALHGDQFDVNSIHSFNARLAIWDDALEWFHSSPLLGAGPLREVIPSFSDNYYVYLLSRYGIVGLSLYAVYSVYIAAISVLAVLTNKCPQREWGLLTLASVVTVNVANYTMDAFPVIPIAAVSLLYAGYLSCLVDMSGSTIRRKFVPQVRPKRRIAYSRN
jgi:hypothetical protein